MVGCIAQLLIYEFIIIMIPSPRPNLTHNLIIFTSEFKFRFFKYFHDDFLHRSEVLDAEILSLGFVQHKHWK